MPSVASSTHNIVAYRFTDDKGVMHDGIDDDGEYDGGRCILNSMKEDGINNALVVVSREFVDDSDADKVRKYFNDECGCKNGCHLKNKPRDIYKHILKMHELEIKEKDIFIMVTLVDYSSDKETTKRGRKRQRLRHQFSFLGKAVCRATFLLVFDIGKYALEKIVKHVNQNGITLRSNGNTGKKPSKSFTFEDIQKVSHFIANYAEEFGIPQPAAPRGRDSVPPIYLPCDTTRIFVHIVVKSLKHQFVLIHDTFDRIWLQCLPHIKIASPRDDVCTTCQKYRKAVVDAVTEGRKIGSNN
ncbi:LOW QUALITY PROTEIN: hypothetical protein KUTeg_012016 [Tegillarca granosa]|uniref:Impact N-terminal domain-containing protein n=1 Tax=Tegillarca granosa TaxID=220873 RepID=A0ABQ9F1S4_TEGGR|nr:LOW QUALITY PROTEIN: hypothetical protein KUTeg_012016 [Tegillarca granosa]